MSPKQKLDDLPYEPLCDSCGKLAINGYGCLLDKEGYVQEIYCRDCNNLKRRQQYMKDKVLTSHLMSAAFLYAYAKENKNRQNDDPLLEEIHKDIQSLNDLIMEFSTAVWNAGLFEQERKASKWKKSSRFGDGYKFLTLSSAGRVLFTFQSKTGHNITLIAEAGKYGGGVNFQGAFATKELATTLLSSFIEEWKANKINLKDDNKVSFG